jgi:hypothetical protein
MARTKKINLTEPLLTEPIVPILEEVSVPLLNVLESLTPISEPVKGKRGRKSKKSLWQH